MAALLKEAIVCNKCLKNFKLVSILYDTNTGDFITINVGRPKPYLYLFLLNLIYFRRAFPRMEMKLMMILIWPTLVTRRKRRRGEVRRRILMICLEMMTRTNNKVGTLEHENKKIFHNLLHYKNIRMKLQNWIIRIIIWTVFD